MATLAPLTVGPEVAVILAMTGDAQRRSLLRTRCLMMTVGALQLGVRSQQRKSGLLGVIKAP